MRPYVVKDENGQILYKKKVANIIIPMESFTEEEKTILEDDEAKWTDEMDKKFKKIMKILQALKKIDGRISEDNLFEKCDMECQWLGKDRLNRIVEKIQKGKSCNFHERL